MNAIFRPHGRFKVWTEGQLLITELTGPWNRELVEYWAAQAFQLASTFSAERPYVGITIVHDSILCPADAIDRIARAIQVSQTKLHCIENVIVAADDVDGKDLVKSTYHRIGLRHFLMILTVPRCGLNRQSPNILRILAKHYKGILPLSA